jgi:eukaryotic-like serine/threonine-protein kinase
MNVSPQHRLLGHVIADRYRVLEVLGEGGMGAVYLAEHLTLHKQVALKVVHREHAGNAELAARFAREAMATSRIEHPNVISALDFGQLDDGTAYLAVQLVRGPSLTRVLRAEGRLPWPRAVNVAAQIADALCAAHGHGIVHRDLKPDNVLLQYLDDGGELVKVLDFGVAKFSPVSDVPSKARADVTKVGFVVGTPGYMAPEQAVGSEADPRSDLYALGVILWECLTGKNLWAGADLAQLVDTQLTRTPPRLQPLLNDPTFPPGLDELVAGLLARRPSERPQDAASVRDALRALARLDEAGQKRFHTGQRPIPSTAPIEPMPSQAREAPQSGAISPSISASEGPKRGLLQAQRGRRIAWSVAGLTLVVLSVIVGLVLSGLVELRTKPEVAEVARRVADGLSLPSAQDSPAQAEQKPLAASPRTGLPLPLDDAFDRMVEGVTRDERVAAASELLGHEPVDEVPQYVRRMAYLQIAKHCTEKRDEVVRLRELGDARALPLLMQLASRPREGCGRKKREDCLGCLRTELDEAVHALGGPATVTPERAP